MKKTIIFSLMILLNLSFFQVALVNAALVGGDLDSASELQKRASLNNGSVEQKKSSSTKDLGALKAKKLDWVHFAIVKIIPNPAKKFEITEKFGLSVKKGG